MGRNTPSVCTNSHCIPAQLSPHCVIVTSLKTWSAIWHPIFQHTQILLNEHRYFWYKILYKFYQIHFWEFEAFFQVHLHSQSCNLAECPNAFKLQLAPTFNLHIIFLPYRKSMFSNWPYYITGAQISFLAVIAKFRPKLLCLPERCHHSSNLLVLVNHLKLYKTVSVMVILAHVMCVASDTYDGTAEQWQVHW